MQEVIRYRIECERHAQQSQRNVNWCYLCNELLPTSGAPGWKKALSREHVIPTSLLQSPRIAEDQRWPLVLWVHKECDRIRKQRLDSDVKCASAVNAGDWSVNNIVNFSKHFKLTEIPGEFGNIPAMTGGGRLVQAVEIWIRGLHSAVYGDRLPDDVQLYTAPPVVSVYGMRGMSVDEEIDDYYRSEDTVRSAVRSALAANLWHGVHSKGSRFRFLAAWIDLTSQATSRWACAWALYHSGVQAWSRSVHGRSIPWHGMYFVKQPPRSVAAIDMSIVHKVINEPRRQIAAVQQAYFPASSFCIISRRRRLN